MLVVNTLRDAATKSATVMSTAVGASANCCATVSPVEISAPAAATKPSMARRPFMSSGPEAMKLEPSGPEKAKACCRVKDLGLAGTTGSSGVAASVTGSSAARTMVERRAARAALGAATRAAMAEVTVKADMVVRWMTCGRL